MASRRRTGLAIIAIGVMLFAFTFLKARSYSSVREREWVEVPLRGIEARAVHRKQVKRMAHYEVLAEYSYEVAGIVHQGTTIWPDGLRFTSMLEWRATSVAQALKKQKTVFVDSSNPQSSLLFVEGIDEADFNAYILAIRVMGLSLLLVGGWMAVPRRRTRIYQTA